MAEAAGTGRRESAAGDCGTAPDTGESAADAAASAEDPGDGRRRDAGRDAFSGGISGTGDGGAVFGPGPERL